MYLHSWLVLASKQDGCGGRFFTLLYSVLRNRKEIKDGSSSHANSRGGDVCYKTIASTTGTKTFTQKINDLSSAFGNLTQDEKCRSILQQGSNVIFRYVGGSREAYVYNSINSAVYDFSNKKHYSQSNVTSPYQEDSTDSNNNTLYLKVLTYEA